MSQVVASLYELHEEIGSGGGGVVYLGRHLRLGKWVVLKADKRTLAARPEVLRREVDALKNLSHTYIPQVYDFLEEDGVVYTVMDYIEGESLDKPLKRGERFSQAQVIEWLRQMLEALCYLHGRPPYGILHGDIKPANVMLTPQNDIRLIDYNIALALGEDGAVQVGHSRGYASPEHYGSGSQLTPGNVETLIVTDTPGTHHRQPVMLDVRSDVYSVGATAYHLLSGRRPADRAEDVLPVDGCSPAVAAIIQKAMAPDPQNRYQTAKEMLSALEGLHENDPRMKRHRRRMVLSAAALSLMFLLGGFAAFVGLKRMERTQNAYVLAEYSANALQEGDVEAAVHYAVEALPVGNGLFDPPWIPQARRSLVDALGVYDLSDGFKAHRTITLSSQPIKVVLSPGGTRLAVLISGEAQIFDMENGQQLAKLSADHSALSDMVFMGEDRLIYAGDGALKAYEITEDEALWSAEAATGISLSANGTKVSAVYRDEGLARVYDAGNGRLLQEVDFGGKRQRVTVNDGFADPEDNLFAMDEGGKWLAVSFEDGSLRAFNLENTEGDLEILDPGNYRHFEGGFFGQYLAFSATGGGESVFVVIDMENQEQTGGFSSENIFHVKTDESGIYISQENILVKIHPVTGEQAEVAYTPADIADFDRSGTHTLTALADGGYAFFDGEARSLGVYAGREHTDFVQTAGEWAVIASRDSPVLRVMRLETHPEAQLSAYDDGYLHDEARISADGKSIMLFRYDGFRIYDIAGGILAEVSIPDAEQVYDQQYRRDEQGSRLEVVYNDGLVRAYSGADGTVLYERMDPAPSGDGYEEFITDRLRITSPLHGAPVAYDLATGERIRELEPDAYLTYVTQVGEYVLTEYISAQGERYGLLLDAGCETVAYLPGLCDVRPDGTLVFDDMRGNLREAPIYTTEELLFLAQDQYI